MFASTDNQKCARPIIARVAVNIPLFQVFDYCVTQALWLTNPNDSFWIGRRVLIPFRNREVVGIILDLFHANEKAAAEKLKEIQAVDETGPALSQIEIDLASFCQERYFRAGSEYLFLCYPPRLRRPVRHTKQSDITSQLSALPAPKKQKVKQSSSDERSLVDRFQQPFELNEEQNSAVKKLTQALGKAAFYLLFGVTGSGKTEVYLHTIVAMLSKQPKGQILLLVPEVILTPQLEQWFRKRFQLTTIEPDIVCLHSQLTEAKKQANWHHAITGRAQIIIGTRSAIFTPLPKLVGMILDEEHDVSYRQVEEPYYITREVAHQRARLQNVPLILASATPSLEAWRAAKSGHYERIDLTRRAVPSSVLPKVSFIDIRPLPLKEGLSPPFIQKMNEALNQGHQCLLFINRRGFAPVLYCTDCGWISTCPHCHGTRLVIHATDRLLHCHHCGYTCPIPVHCPHCEGLSLRPLGQGTQRIEQALASLFPTKKIARIDSDTLQKKGAWEQIRQEIANKEIDILVGTQILTKGHDFPNINFVGVINADNGLYSSDFRAEELLFAQLLQVAGRAGRAGQQGTVWIQTVFPAHPIFQALAHHDYVSHAERLLHERKWIALPPYVQQCMILLSGQDVQILQHKMDQIVVYLTEQCEDHALTEEITILDPVPLRVTQKKYKAQLYVLVQALQRQKLHNFLKKILNPLLKMGASAHLKIIFTPYFF